MRAVLHAQAIKIRVGVLALMVAASMTVAAAPTAAAAAPTAVAAAPTAVAAAPTAAPLSVDAVWNCSHGIRQPYPGLYYAWAYCGSGSGYFRVGFGCQYFTGETYWVWGPTRRVGGGVESRGQCHAYTRPTVTTVQYWS
jgi:hypothetical protein